MNNNYFTTMSGKSIPHRDVGNSIRVESIHNTDKHYIEVYSSKDHNWHRIEQFDNAIEAHNTLKEHFKAQNEMYFEPNPEVAHTGNIGEAYWKAKAERDAREAKQ